MQHNLKQLIKFSIWTLSLSLFASVILYFFIDRDLSLWIYNSGFYNKAYPIAKIITFMGSGKLLYKKIIALSAIFALPILLYNPKCRFAQMCVFLSCAFLIKVYFIWMLKFTLGRFRPIMLIRYNQYDLAFFQLKSLMHSMPSGHAGAAFAAAGSISIFYPRLKVLAFICGTLVLISRVLLLKHFASDIIMGAAIGGLLPYWLMHGINKIHNLKLSRSFRLSCKAQKNQIQL